MKPLSISDLRAQRDLVKRHLDWLDARIAENAPDAVGDDAPRATPAAAPAAETPPPAPPAETLTEPAATEAPLTPAAEEVAEKILSTYTDGPSGLPSSAKTGCIAAAVIFVLIFLFILFGLPYFLYKDKGKAAPQPPTVTETPAHAR